jgi:5-(carboxyamino)imidazole ribonucleotide synthase
MNVPTIVVLVNPARVVAPRVGVVGGGQLALMMGEAAADCGVDLTVLADSPRDPATTTIRHVIVGSPRDEAALRELAAAVDVVTFDHELVDLELFASLENDGVIFRPSPRALRFSVDKAFQRQTLADAEIPVPRFVVTGDLTDATTSAFLADLRGEPVVKAPRGGYDGRGVYFPTSRVETVEIFEQLRLHGDVLLEERLALRGEFAQQVVRGVDGTCELFPLVATVQSEGMCVEVRYPSELSSDLVARANELTTQLVRLVEPVGVMAVEYFLSDAGLLVNELALRPHNSGHWTIEGTTASQFSQHLRAVSGQELAPIATTEPAAVMVNVVGASHEGSLQNARGVVGVFVHDYAKAWRPGRKLGHVTALGDDLESTHVRAWKSAVAYGTAAKET